MKVGLVHTVGNGQEILNTGSSKSKIKLDKHKFTGIINEIEKEIEKSVSFLCINR